MADIPQSALDELRKRYTPPVIPPCRICGAKLEIGKCGGGGPTEYNCSVADYLSRDTEQQLHFIQSRYIDYKAGGDETVIALIDDYEDLRDGYNELIIYTQPYD